MGHLKLIMATDEHNAVGLNGALPFHCSADLSFFRALTLNEVCVKGKNTDVTLKDRTVLTMGVDLFDLRELHGGFVIGGPKTWVQALDLNLIGTAFVTIIKGYHDADVFFDYRKYIGDWHSVTILEKSNLTFIKFIKPYDK